jgi:cytoskeletal protein CcmA (bactofilin family)
MWKRERPAPVDLEHVLSEAPVLPPPAVRPVAPRPAPLVEVPAERSFAGRGSTLGATLRFKGELSTGEDLLIYGQVEGTTGPAPKVPTGPEAHVKPGVNADVIIVEGRVEGNLKADVSITVRPKANVRGNLEAPVINIAEGATFNGGITMEPGDSAASSTTGRVRESGPLRTGTGN